MTDDEFKTEFSYPSIVLGLKSLDNEEAGIICRNLGLFLGETLLKHGKILVYDQNGNRILDLQNTEELVHIFKDVPPRSKAEGPISKRLKDFRSKAR